MIQRARRWLFVAVLASLPILVVGILVFSPSAERTGVVEANGTPANPGAYSYSYAFTNNTGQQATDLHITFSSAIDKPAVTTQPPDCEVSDPLGPEVTQPSESEVTAVWSSKCIAPVPGPSGMVTVRVFSKDLVLQPVSVTWTNFDTPLPTPTSAATATATAAPSVTPTSTRPPCVDLDGDGRTTGRDIARIARALFTKPGARRWNPAADLDGNGVVNLADLMQAIGYLRNRICR